MDLVLYEKLAAYESRTVFSRHPGEVGGTITALSNLLSGPDGPFCGPAEPQASCYLRELAPGHLWPGAIPAGFSFDYARPSNLARSRETGVKGLWECKVTPAYCACQGGNTIGCILNNDGLDSGSADLFSTTGVHRAFIITRRWFGRGIFTESGMVRQSAGRALTKSGRDTAAPVVERKLAGGGNSRESHAATLRWVAIFCGSAKFPARLES
jgi:hypothetical protein